MIVKRALNIAHRSLLPDILTQKIFNTFFIFPGQFLKQQVEFVNDQMTRSDSVDDGKGRPLRRKKNKQSQGDHSYNEPTAVEQSQMKYDSTGMYHWYVSI